MKLRLDAKKRTYFSFLGLYILGVLLITMAVMSPARGLPYGIGAYGTCQFGSCSITLTSSVSLSADITPSGAATCTVVKDDVSVRTGSSTGYTLQVSDSDTDTGLNKSGGGTIAATTGTRTAPSTLTANKWGYRIDNLAGFGAGPTSAASNVSIPAVQFAGMPVLGSADLIATKASAASVAEVTPVWYGLCLNTSIPTGSYTDTVIYTAITN